MARAPRIEYPDAFYHVPCRGSEQKLIFRDDQDWPGTTLFESRASDRGSFSG
jgi:hypothetical protein